MKQKNWKAMRLHLYNRCLTGLLSVLGYAPCSDKNEEAAAIAPMYGTPPVRPPRPAEAREEAEAPCAAPSACEIPRPAYAV